jgi:hypothetical protein
VVNTHVGFVGFSGYFDENINLRTGTQTHSMSSGVGSYILFVVMQLITEASVAPNKQGPGVLLVRRNEQPMPKDEATNNSFPVLHLDGHDIETSRTVPSTYTDGDLRLLRRPKPGDVCTIQYRCFILESIYNGQQIQRRHRLVDTTKGFDESSGDISLCSIQDASKIPSRPPLEFEIGKGSVIRGLEVAVQRMLPLEDTVYEVILPYSYAYGHRGHLPEIPPKSDLLFEIKLTKIDYKDKSAKGNCGGWFKGIREMVERFWRSAT